MRRGWKGVAHAVAGLLLAAALLYLVARGVDRRAVAEALRSASLEGLLAAAAIQFGHNLFRVLRWRALLAPVRSDIRFRPMFDAVIRLFDPAEVRVDRQPVGQLGFEVFQKECHGHATSQQAGQLMLMPAALACSA